MKKHIRIRMDMLFLLIFTSQGTNSKTVPWL
jgi:hypothetical protein